MAIQIPVRPVQTLPAHIQALPPRDRLIYCIGIVASEWQHIIDTMVNVLPPKRWISDPNPNIPPFSTLADQWCRIVSASVAIPNPALIGRINKIICSYHLLRDALVHGNPDVDTFHHLPGNQFDVVKFRLFTKKAYYKAEYKRKVNRYLPELNPAMRRTMMREVDHSQDKFEFYYSLPDIEYLAAHGLKELFWRVADASRIVLREASMPGVNPSQGSLAYLAQKLPRPVQRLDGVEFKMPPIQPADVSSSP